MINTGVHFGLPLMAWYRLAVSALKRQPGMIPIPNQ